MFCGVEKLSRRGKEIIPPILYMPNSFSRLEAGGGLGLADSACQGRSETTLLHGRHETSMERHLPTLGVRDNSGGPRMWAQHSQGSAGMLIVTLVKP